MVFVSGPLNKSKMYQPSLSATHQQSGKALANAGQAAEEAEVNRRSSEEPSFAGIDSCARAEPGRDEDKTPSSQGSNERFISAHRLVTTARRQSCGNLRVCGEGGWEAGRQKGVEL